MFDNNWDIHDENNESENSISFQFVAYLHSP